MATEEVYQFLKNQNRPFSASDILANVGKDHGKSAVLKCLDKLVNKQKIIEKVYGKQKVYCVVQDGNIDSKQLDEQLREIDREINDLLPKIKETDEKLQANLAQINGLKGKMTTEEVKAEKQKLEEEIKQMKEKLAKLSEHTSQPISEDEKLKIAKEHELYTKEYRKRKKMCMEIVNSIMEGYPKSKKHLLEDIGIETDEDVGFKLD